MLDTKLKQWEKNFWLIEKQYADTVLWWAKHKSCDCTEQQCVHFNKLATDLLSAKVKQSRDQLDELHLLRDEVVQLLLDSQSE